MSENNTSTFKIRPYARLLSMLGDQLIKNEIVALTELIKNAYDADAENCYLDFINVGDGYEIKENSIIEISDDGYGMSKETLTTHFLSPATPIKQLEQTSSHKGRICQGEKGVGRFSMFKLGKKVTVYSKQQTHPKIHKISLNFENYDDEFISVAKDKEQTEKSDLDNDKVASAISNNNGEKSGQLDEAPAIDRENKTVLFLDELNIEYEEANLGELPLNSTIEIYNQGTIIKIEAIKSNWDTDHIKQLKDELLKFSPLEIDDEEVVTNRDFNIIIRKNHKEDAFYDDRIKELKDIINNYALYKISGRYNENISSITFNYSEAGAEKKEVTIRLKDLSSPNNDFEERLRALTYYKKEIKPIFENDESQTECGSFEFEFYIFDFAATTADEYGLNKKLKDKIRDHRVFLYRDGVRVQPYGAPNDDWLQIDRKRATVRANEMFSNEQIIGQIKITKKGNINLKDKTSREGIIEDGQAFEQLTAIIRTFLSLIRTHLYQRYVFSRKKRKDHEREVRNAEYLESFNKLDELLGDNDNARKYLQNIQKVYYTQQSSYKQRLNVVESLAGVGLSVEASSHDIMLTVSRLQETFFYIKHDVGNANFESLQIAQLQEKITRAEEMLALVEMKMRNLQSLFVSSKQRAKVTRIEPLIKKIERIYAKQYYDKNIIVEYNYIGKSPVVGKLIDAVVYQVFINLFDNALYWLSFVNNERKVTITFNGNLQEVVFSDSGDGVMKDDIPYIFDAFFSGKGEEGRGLGLYIAKRLLNRYKYDIEVITDPSEKVDKGANFRISFVSSEE